MMTMLTVRTADFNSVFPAGVNVAASFDRSLAYARGQAMGAEHQGKGSDFQLGPVAGPIGRSPEGGRNWEGFRWDYSHTLMLQDLADIPTQSRSCIDRRLICPDYTGHPECWCHCLCQTLYRQ